MEQKALTDSKDIPIIGREALLSLVEWVKIRRQQDERTISGDSGDQNEHSGGPETTDHSCVRSDGQSQPNRSEQPEGIPDEEGS